MISAAGKYKKTIERRLKCCKKTKKRLIGGLEPTFEAFFQDAPDADCVALCAAFGPPEEMAKQLMQQVTQAEHKTYKRHRIITTVIIGMLAALFIGFTVYIYVQKSIPSIIEYDTVVAETFEITEPSTD